MSGPNNPFVEANREAETRHALQKALRDLERAKTRKAELVEAVYQGARDGITALDRTPVPSLARGRKKDSETAIAIVSDLQLAKITPDYNTEVCESRMRRLAQKIVELTEIQRSDHPVRECRVFLLGDIVEGELIFPGQAHLIDASLYRQVTVDGPRILRDFLATMLANFDRVHVTGVIGNHGRMGGKSRRDYTPEANADRMLYRIMAMLFEKEPRLSFNIPEGNHSHWFAVEKVGDRHWFLFHGDQVRAYNGIPWYGFDRKVPKWFMSIFQYDYAAHGHFHTPNRLYINGVTVWANGSTESANPYALEQLAAAGEPAQWLLFQNRNRVTAEYLVELSDLGPKLAP